jgi:hypothetical protein
MIVYVHSPLNAPGAISHSRLDHTTQERKPGPAASSMRGYDQFLKLNHGTAFDDESDLKEYGVTDNLGWVARFNALGDQAIVLRVGSGNSLNQVVNPDLVVIPITVLLGKGATVLKNDLCVLRPSLANRDPNIRRFS